MPTQLIAGDSQNEASFAGGNDGALEVRIGPAGSKATGLSVSSVGDVAALGKLTQKGGAPVPRMLLLPAKATTSGTSIDFSPSDGTSIPSWAKKITVTLDGVSTNGASPVQLQLGTSGGVETAGYACGTTLFSAGAANSITATSGLRLELGIEAAAAIRSGSVNILTLTGNSWAMSGVVSRTDSASGSLANASKTLAGALDRVRITTVNGTDTFDAGSVSILVEGYE